MKKLFLLVCPTAGGGTHWIDFFTGNYPKVFARIKTWTTRKPRGPEDEKDYNFISEMEFIRMKERGEFYETDYYQDHWKGSSFLDYSRLLETHNCLKKITPAGAIALKKLFPAQTKIVFLTIPLDLLEENYIARFEKQNCRRIFSHEIKSLRSRCEKENDDFYQNCFKLNFEKHVDIEIVLDRTEGDAEKFRECFDEEGIKLQPI